MSESSRAAPVASTATRETATSVQRPHEVAHETGRLGNLTIAQLVAGGAHSFHGAPLGNQAELRRALHAEGVRARREISDPTDASEREADHIAAMLTTKSACACGGGAACEACAPKAGHAPTVQLKAAATAVPATPMVGAVRAELGGGQRLAAGQRNFYERALGASLDGVRLHADSRAAAAATAIGARAFTVGHDVAFAPGQFAPGTRAGDELLAHELVHVAQADHGGASEPQVHRQPDPNAKPAAKLGPKGDYYYFRGVMMSGDREFMFDELRRLISRHGIIGGDMWFDALQGRGFDVPLPFSATVVAAGGGALRARNPLDAMQDMQNDARKNDLAPVAIPLAIEIYPLVRQEAIDFLNRFQTALGTTLETILSESEKRIETERTRYGIEKKDGVRAFDAKNTVAFQGLVGAARDLLAIRQKIDGLMAQRQRLMGSRGKGGFYVPDANRAKYDELSGQIAELEQRYGNERTGAALRYPALGAILDDQSGSLERLASGELSSHDHGRWGPRAGTAGLIGDVLESRQASINSVRDKVKGNPGRLWDVPQVVAVTRIAMATQGIPMANKVIDEYLERRNLDHEIAGLLLAVAALVLAIPSGGTSLGAAAAVGTFAISAYQAMESLSKYQLEEALANTDLDKRAYAIASEEPSLFWVALDVVFAVADGAAALKAFRALKSDAKLALAVEKEAEAAEAAKRLEATAENVKPGLGKRLLDKLAELRGRKGPGRLVGAGEREAEALAKASETVGKEARSAKTIAYVGGHEVKVTSSGLIVVCTECVWLRERFAREIIEDAGVAERLGKAEDEVRKAGGAFGQTKSEVEAIANKLQQAQKARVAAELGPEAAEQLEKLNKSMDEMRTGFAADLKARPDLESEVSRIESIVDPTEKAAAMERMRDALNDARVKRIDQWRDTLPKKPTPTSSVQDQYEIAHTGSMNYQISGGGEKVWADGIVAGELKLQDTKLIDKPGRSPYIKDSACPPFVRDNAVKQAEDEFRRYAAVLKDPATPVKTLEVITNDARAVPFFEDLLAKYGISGTVVVKP